MRKIGKLSGLEVFYTIVEPLEKIYNEKYNSKIFSEIRKLCGEPSEKTIGDLFIPKLKKGKNKHKIARVSVILPQNYYCSTTNPNMHVIISIFLRIQ